MILEIPKLTKYQPGSLKELTAISLPLMITALSTTFMQFFDRVILAQCSLDAMNAAASLGMVCAIFQYMGAGITGIAEVFVGQAYGAQQNHKISDPVWQMIWFSLMLIPLFVLITVIGEPYIVPQNLCEQGTGFFRWMMPTSFLLPITAAVAAFFVGQGQTKIIIIAAIISNIGNAILAYMLVVKLNMGAEGTGIATVIAQTLQFIILFTVFLNKENHSLFNTRYARWNGKSFKDCLTYGGPNAFGHLFEITGWAVLQNFLARFNLDYMTVGTIAQSCFIFLTFAGDGLQKALISIASNMIGAGVGGRIRQVLRSALKFQLILSVLIFIPLVGFPEVIGKIFIADLEISPLRQDVIIALRGVWIFLLCDAGVWILASILTAGGDTRFIMVTNALTSWSCVTVPAYIWLHYFPSEPSTLWKWLIPLYGAINLGIFINRYKAKHWLKKLA